MHPIVVALFAATLATGLSVGVRLLLLYRRTRGVPELMFGLAALGTCLAGLVRGWLVSLGADASPFVTELVQVGFALLFAAAPLGMVLGTWRVFRPDERWARALAFALGAVLALSVVALWVPEPFQRTRSVVLLLAATGVSVWNASEALLHHGRLRRRMRLGLADSVTTHQFLCWGIAMVANTVTRLLALATVAFTRVEPLRSTAYVLPTALLGFATLAFLYLAFFPPLVLQDWLVARDVRVEA
jgi:hypothetical protein